MGQSRNENILENILGASNPIVPPQSRIEELLIQLLEQGSTIDPEVVEQAVSDWLDEHPEATTTVQDGSITLAKLASAVAAKINAVDQLSEEIATKLDANQGSANAGKIMVIDSTGEIVPGVGGSGGTVAVDSAFSSTSENPVQNKVIYGAVTKTETVSGSTPAITAVENTRYICGEVSTLAITLPASGIIDVVFESGSTATVLTITGTVSWANDFDATALDANTIYEISIADGLGVACAWT